MAAQALRVFLELEEVISNGTGPQRASVQQNVEELNFVLSAAVQEQLVADVPVGAFLSGGIDSSLITLLMQQRSAAPVQTFTIGFQEKEYDESDAAAAVARHLGTRHSTFKVSPEDAIAAIPELGAIYDEPFADSSQLPATLVSRFARQYVTVVLSGDGGDESFGGYNRHYIAPRIWAKQRLCPRILRAGVAHSLRMPGGAAWAKVFARWNSVFGAVNFRLPLDKLYKIAAILPARSPADVYRRLTYAEGAVQILDNAHVLHAQGDASTLPWPAGLTFAEGMMFADTQGYLQDDILVKVDKSDEREPRDTCSFPYPASRLSSRLEAATSREDRSAMRKAGFRRLSAKHLPRSFIERPKSGFSVPIDQWLRGPLRPWAEDLLNSSSLRHPPSKGEGCPGSLALEHLSANAIGIT